jgi:hypothetical protein
MSGALQTQCYIRDQGPMGLSPILVAKGVGLGEWPADRACAR